MKFEKVISSNIEAVAYDQNTKILAVYFKSKSLYLYMGVTEVSANNFVTSESVGKHLNQHIKPYYSFVELDLKSLDSVAAVIDTAVLQPINETTELSPSINPVAGITALERAKKAKAAKSKSI